MGMARERQATIRGTVNDSPKRTDDLLQNRQLTIIHQEEKLTHQNKTKTKIK